MVTVTTINERIDKFSIDAQDEHMIAKDGMKVKRISDKPVKFFYFRFRRTSVVCTLSI